MVFACHRAWIKSMSVAATGRIPSRDGGSQIWQTRPPYPASLPRSSRRLAVGAAAVSLLAHGVLLLAIVLREPSVNHPRPVREILVELAAEEPLVTEKRPLAAGASEKSVTPQEAAPAVKPAVAAAALDPAKHSPEAPVEELGKDIVNQEKVDQAGEAEKSASGMARRAVHGASGQPAKTFLSLPFDSGPERFRAVAVPLPSESGGEAMSYRFIVGGLLERAKLYPGSARQRGAKGIATVGFVLDPSGVVASVVLLRSSGEADLDAEGVALVNRAAPYPPPPPGAQRSFAIEVAFGMGH